MPGIRETIIAALHKRLQSPAATVLRDEALPERIPPAGLICPDPCRGRVLAGDHHRRCRKEGHRRQADHPGWLRTAQRLRFVYRRGQPSLLEAETRLNSKIRAVASKSKTGRGAATVPIFLLVPQVKLLKRLDLARDVEPAVDGVPGRIMAAWVDGKLT